MEFLALWNSLLLSTGIMWDTESSRLHITGSIPIRTPGSEPVVNGPGWLQLDAAEWT